MAVVSVHGEQTQSATDAFFRSIEQLVGRFGTSATADYFAITAERNRREAIASGRHREGRPGNWYASITWSWQAWDAIWGNRPPRWTR